jgi:hypothetical protein
LVWKIEIKEAQIINEDICLPFDLVIILWAVGWSLLYTGVCRRGERWMGGEGFNISPPSTNILGKHCRVNRFKRAKLL